MTIFKYDLPADFGPFAIPMPAGATILHIAAQHDSGMLWAEVDADAKLVARDFVAVPTGGDVPKAGTYLGTFSSVGGRYVHHIFEVTK